MKSLSGPILTASVMRRAELGSDIPLEALMTAAGTALAEAVWRFGCNRPTLVLCGPGNNGGDGYVCATLLAARGLDVSVAVSGKPNSRLASDAMSAWQGSIEGLAGCSPKPVIVDALFGTGLDRALDPEIARHLDRLSASAALVIAADIPSGMQSDTGADLGGARADLTVAFGAAKPAHVLEPAASQCGTTLMAEIGLQPLSDVQVLAPPSLTRPTMLDHKYTRGMVAVIGGSMSGAGALSATAALRAGAGLVLAVNVRGSVPHAIVLRDGGELTATLADDRLGAVVIGPGLGRDADARDALRAATACRHPIVLDGDALFEPLRKRRAATVLTPHEGEFLRLFGYLDGSKIDRARAAAIHSGATVIYKGADTVIASPDGRVTCARPGTPWLATAGTGDVLAGVVGAMLARGMEPHDAACAAVWLHAEAARNVGPGLIADDISGQLAALL